MASDPGAPLVLRNDADGVATIELNRPHRKNALTGPLGDELAAHVRAASADKSVAAILLCGSGGSFCSGLDLTEYNADPPPPWLATSAASLRQAHVALAECGLPIVVALERYAINGGAAYALAGDFIVAGETAWLQVGEVALGIPAPMNLAWLASRYPLSTVIRVVLGGHRIPGPELHRMNIAHEVVDDGVVRERAHALAVELAAHPRDTSIQLKRAAMDLAVLSTATETIPRAAALLPVATGFTSRLGTP